jgi:hypothetical protein
MSFGTSKKKMFESNLIGQYGNGLKSGTMRLGMDFILITKQKSIVTVIFVSRTFHDKEKITDRVIYPMPSFHEHTWEPYFLDEGEGYDNSMRKHQTEVELIFKYSPYKSKDELTHEFLKIKGESGTIITIYNMKCTPGDEKPELDVVSREDDILTNYGDEELPLERRSFRAYSAIIYSEPKMKIYIQNVKVRTKILEYTLLEPRFYTYQTKNVFITKAKKDLESARDQKDKAAQKYQEAKTVQVNQRNRYGDTSNKTELKELRNNDQKVVETKLDMEKKEEIYEAKKKYLSDPKTLTFKFGININNRAQSGIFIYNCHRLIVMYEKPKEILNNPEYSGIIGFVDVPYEVLEPTHNKQSFESSNEHTKLTKALLDHMKHYVIEIKDHLRQNQMKDLWKYYGYDGDSDVPSMDMKMRKLRFFKTPLVLQCDKCLQWREIPSSTGDVGKESENFPDTWSCQDLKIFEGSRCCHPQNLKEIDHFTYAKQTVSENASNSRITISSKPSESPQVASKPMPLSQINNEKKSSQKNSSQLNPRDYYQTLTQMSRNPAFVQQQQSQVPLVRAKIEVDVDTTDDQQNDINGFVDYLQDTVQHQQQFNNSNKRTFSSNPKITSQIDNSYINRTDDDNQYSGPSRPPNQKKNKDKHKTRTRIVGLSSTDSDSDEDYRPPHSAKKQKSQSNDDNYRNMAAYRPDTAQGPSSFSEKSLSTAGDHRRIKELESLLNAKDETIVVLASQIR